MSFFERSIRILAPPDCVGCGAEGLSLCEACSAAEIIPFGERCFICGQLSLSSRTCKTCRPSSPSHVWVCADYQGSTKELLRAYKFHHQRAAANVIAEQMVDSLSEFVELDVLIEQRFLVLPVPTASARRRARSFAHAELLAQKLSKKIGLEFGNHIGRLGQSQQVGAPRKIRLKQQSESYYPISASKIRGRKILLVDDVVTTGATLRAVTKVLRACGARGVDALVFAKRI